MSADRRARRPPPPGGLPCLEGFPPRGGSPASGGASPSPVWGSSLGGDGLGGRPLSGLGGPARALQLRTRPIAAADERVHRHALKSECGRGAELLKTGASG